MKLAVITTSKYHYDNYLVANKINPENAKQVSVKRNIDNEIFTDKVLIEESNNVTDWVINNVKIHEKI